MLDTIMVGATIGFSFAGSAFVLLKLPPRFALADTTRYVPAVLTALVLTAIFYMAPSFLTQRPFNLDLLASALNPLYLFIYALLVFVSLNLYVLFAYDEASLKKSLFLTSPIVGIHLVAIVAFVAYYGLLGR